MRSPDTFTESLCTLKKFDDFVPAAHPLRSIRAMVNEASEKLEDLFSRMYGQGRGAPALRRKG
jgi:hypothetical protein